MDKQELMARIVQAEQQLNELKAELEKHEKMPTFERVAEGQVYFVIRIGSGFPVVYEKQGYQYDDYSFEEFNYFHTRERAQEVADKIKFLLKMERLHDIYCSGYKPDWNNDEISKWYVIYSIERNGYMAQHVYYAKDEVRTYFPDKETAQKVCDMLNKELKKEN